MKRFCITLLLLFTALCGISGENIPEPAASSPNPDPVEVMDNVCMATYYSHTHLVLMNKPHKLQKLGKEQAEGELSGNVSYRTKIRGFSGLVYINYTDYSDFEGFTLNGNSNVKANLYANGKMFGTLKISGKYNAEILYDNLKIKKGNAGGGYYTVIFPDGQRTDVPWDAVRNKIVPIDDADQDVKDTKTLED